MRRGREAAGRGCVTLKKKGCQPRCPSFRAPEQDRAEQGSGGFRAGQGAEGPGALRAKRHHAATVSGGIIWVFMWKVCWCW